MAKQEKGTGFSLKDQLFNRDRVEFLAGLFRDTDSDFDASAFVKETMAKLTELDLKQRIIHIAEVLERHLDADFKVAAQQITRALPAPLDPNLSDGDFGDFIFAPLGEYVVRNGLDKKHVKRSLKTLKAITQRFSMEDAIRAFINHHTDETLMELEKWSADKNYHVRRLVSEGTRPRLPWSGRLSIDIARPMSFLDTLHADTTRYVTRSVANHLNDIAKSNPDMVLKALRRWKRQKRQNPMELQWITSHSLRTLVKQGHVGALKLLGFSPDPKVKVSHFQLTPHQVRPGEAIEFSFEILAERKENLILDYVVDFVKANGSLSPKVHKIKQVSLRKGETLEVSKRHPLRANATTFTLYPGTHHVTLQINGKPYGTQSFELV